MAHALPQYEEVSFRDSGKVLKAIQETIARYRVLATQLADEPTVKTAGKLTIAKCDCLESIVEEMDNARKTIKIWTRTPETSDGLDPRVPRPF